MKRVICTQLASLLSMKTSGMTDSRHSAKVPQHSDVTVLNTQSSSSAPTSSASTERLLASIRDLLETRLHSDTELRRQTDKNQEMMSEWITAAAVIDRICFIVFSTILVVGSLIFYILFLFRP